jgi:DnaJ domain
MQYLLLGLVALLLFLLATRAYTMANPQVLARQLRVGAGVAALAGAGFLVFRGMVGYAMSLAALGSWLIWGIGAAPWGFPTSAQKTPGQTSRVTTDHLEVELDHDSGEIAGRVLKGAFAGRRLEELSPAEMAGLWQDCRFVDPQSAQIIEAYLDGAHPTWREDLARAAGEPGPSPPDDGKMTREQALEVLGLAGDAGDEDIRRAHRELMMKLHPDHGGSTFLAAQINEAKDVLLGKRR